MKKIGIFFICTGRYRIFWKPFYQNAEELLFSESNKYEKHYFVFTDEPDKITEQVHPIKIEKEPWPLPTLKRWHYFLSAKEQWQEMDMVYFFNANLKLLLPLAKELLPAEDRPLICTVHPHHPPGSNYPYERKRRSLACIRPQEGGSYYFMGSLHGGLSEAYRELCEELKTRTDRDLENNIIALWHDESHLNRYALDYPGKIKVLPHTTLEIERENGSRTGGPGSILIQHKTRPQWGGHAWLRGQLPNQIIVKVKSGLGNQLWQYAAALALQENCRKRGETADICINISGYHEKYRPKNRPFLLNELFPDITFSKNREDFFPSKKGYPTYPDTLNHTSMEFGFSQDFLTLPPAIILWGSFQNHKYFEMAKDSFRPRLRPLPQKYQELQKTQELVALHVRRGDYVEKYLDSYGLVSVLHYRAVLKQITERVRNPYILIFSDDVAWVQQNVTPVLQKYSLPWDCPEGSPVEDFSTMAQCRHFIVANSSYSQMAALLGEQSDSLVFMPTMQMLSHNIKCRDFLPPHWQELPYPFYEGEAPPPKVSVIIPVHNTRDYLARCLESVCLQSETAIEIIVVDDASPDESWDMIQNYARRDPRIVPFRHKQNKHLGGARNTGIEAARSEWLLFLDSDDYIAKNTVEVFLHKVSKYPQAALLVCGIVRVCDGQFSTYGGAPKSDLLINQPFEHYRHTRQPELIHCAWGKLWRRELFAQSGLRFPEHMSMEDLALIPRLFYHIQSQSNAALFIPERLFYYQYRSDSLANDRSKAAIQDFCRAVKNLEEWAENLQNMEKERLHQKILHITHCFAEQCRDEIWDYLWNMLPRHYGEDPRTAKFKRKIRKIQKWTQRAQTSLWYRFLLVPNRQKLWVAGKVLSKKLGLYKPLQPLARITKKIIRKLRRWDN